MGRRRLRGRGGQRTQSGIMTIDKEDEECMDCSTSSWSVSSLTRFVRDQFDLDNLPMPEKDSPGVREGSIEDGVAKTCRV